MLKKGILFLFSFLFVCLIYYICLEKNSVILTKFLVKYKEQYDDTLMINNAIAYAVKSGKKNIIMLRGEYIISDTINLPSNINLLGRKNATLKLKDNVKANTILLRLNGGENNIISGLTFDGNVERLSVTDTPFKSEALINQSNTSKKTINIRIENCAIKNTYSRGIRLIKAYDVVVANNAFINVGFDNLSVLGISRGVNIINNNFKSGKSIAIKAYGGVSKINVTNNTIKDFTYAAGDSYNNWSMGIEFANNINDITCNDNIIKNIGDMGISISEVNKGLCQNNEISNIGNGQNNGLGLEIVQSNDITATENSIKNSSAKNAIISRSTNIIYTDNYSELEEDHKGNLNVQHIEISSKQDMVTQNCVIISNTFKGGTRGILGGKAIGLDIINNRFHNNYIAIDYGYYGGGENVRILYNAFLTNFKNIDLQDMETTVVKYNKAQ